MCFSLKLNLKFSFVIQLFYSSFSFLILTEVCSCDSFGLTILWGWIEYVGSMFYLKKCVFGHLRVGRFFNVPLNFVNIYLSDVCSIVVSCCSILKINSLFALFYKCLVRLLFNCCLGTICIVELIACANIFTHVPQILF